ncbi:hypothetical protein SAMN05446635_8053 [Burkholderia sp. OK233]|nr:hypothetical protein SAMN05446635_8053 [Burkholderia sp. OK233]
MLSRQQSYQDLIRSQQSGEQSRLRSEHEQIDAEQISALSRRLGDKWCRYMLTRLASAFRATRMGDLMFREMFSVFEQLATFLATILVRRHCAPPTRIPPALASYGSQRFPVV